MTLLGVERRSAVTALCLCALSVGFAKGSALLGWPVATLVFVTVGSIRMASNPASLTTSVAQ
jgi:hypothetical protein